MFVEDAGVESDKDLVQESSSGDVRGAIQEAMREVSERVRDEQGRFSKVDDEAPAGIPAVAVADPEVGTPAPDLTPATVLTPPADAPAAIRPPDSWTPAAKAKFAALDPEIQQEVMRRETEVHKGFTKQDEHRNLGKNFSDAVTPYLPMIRAEGGEPIAAVQNLLQTAHNLRNASPDQKQEMFIGLAQQYGVDMQGVFNRLSGGQRQVDPQVQQLQQQLATLQQERQQATNTTQAAEQAQINTTIDSFASDPKNLYFANVKPAMAALLSNGQAKDLQEAYDMACWARPDIRPLMQQQNDLQKQAAAREKAQKARAAGVSISGSPTGSAGNVPPAERSLADELRANLREVMGRN